MGNERSDLKDIAKGTESLFEAFVPTGTSCWTQAITSTGRKGAAELNSRSTRLERSRECLPSKLRGGGREFVFDRSHSKKEVGRNIFTPPTSGVKLLSVFSCRPTIIISTMVTSRYTKHSFTLFGFVSEYVFRIQEIWPPPLLFSLPLCILCSFRPVLLLL